MAVVYGGSSIKFILECKHKSVAPIQREAVKGNTRFLLEIKEFKIPLINENQKWFQILNWNQDPTQNVLG